MSVEIIRHTCFQDATYPEQLVWDDDLGFLAEQGDEGRETVRVFGYYTPPVVDGPLPPVLHSRTTYAELEAHERNIDLQGKGIGLRLYNTPKALTGFPRYSTYVGAYSVELSRQHIHDMRKPSDAEPIGKAVRIARHAGRIVQQVCTGLQRTTDRIHAAFPEDTEAVLYNQPPRAALRERVMPDHPDVQSAFLVLRSSQATLTKQGEAGLY